MTTSLESLSPTVSLDITTSARRRVGWRVTAGLAIALFVIPVLFDLAVSGVRGGYRVRCRRLVLRYLTVARNAATTRRFTSRSGEGDERVSSPVAGSSGAPVHDCSVDRLFGRHLPRDRRGVQPALDLDGVVLDCPRPQGGRCPGSAVHSDASGSHGRDDLTHVAHARAGRRERTIGSRRGQASVCDAVELCQRNGEQSRPPDLRSDRHPVRAGLARA